MVIFHIFYESGTSRLGIGTEAPNGQLSVSSDEAEFVVDPDFDHLRVGAWTTSKMSLITDNKERIVIKQHGGVEIKDKLVAINRVTKVVKGGRRFGFAALVVAGDESGKVGFGHGKAKEVPEAIKKATDSAKKTLIKVPLREGRTLHHDIVGVHGSSKVVMRSAPSGTGIIAGGSVRAVFELLGVQDIVAKSVGSTNPYNIIRAAVDGLKNQKSPKIIAARRSKKVGNITSARESS